MMKRSAGSREFDLDCRREVEVEVEILPLDLDLKLARVAWWCKVQNPGKCSCFASLLVWVQFG